MVVAHFFLANIDLLHMVIKKQFPYNSQCKNWFGKYHQWKFKTKVKGCWKLLYDPTYLHIHKWENYIFKVKRSRSHLLDQVFSPEKFQPECNNEEKLDKSIMWDILQGRNLMYKILKKISINIIKMSDFYYFRIKLSRYVTNIRYGSWIFKNV